MLLPLRVVLLWTASLAASSVRATGCADCCAPDGRCERAFKQTPGVCCGALGDGGPACCPMHARCVRCGGAWRCAVGPGDGVCPNDDEQATADLFAFGLFVLCGIVLCCFFCADRQTRRGNDDAVPIVVTGYPALASTTDAVLTGMVGGAIVGTIVASDVCDDVATTEENDGFVADE